MAEREHQEPTAIELGQRFSLFGLQPQKYNPDSHWPRTFESKLTLRSEVLSDLEFNVALGNPFRAPTQVGRNDQLYVVSDLRDLGNALVTRHDLRFAVLDAPRHYYTVEPETKAILSRLRLRVYDEKGNIYEATPDRDDLERWGRVQFSKSFFKIQPLVEGDLNPLILIYNPKDRNELDNAEAEFRLSSN